LLIGSITSARTVVYLSDERVGRTESWPAAVVAIPEFPVMRLPLLLLLRQLLGHACVLQEMAMSGCSPYARC